MHPLAFFVIESIKEVNLAILGHQPSTGENCNGSVEGQLVGRIRGLLEHANNNADIALFRKIRHCLNEWAIKRLGIVKDPIPQFSTEN